MTTKRTCSSSHTSRHSCSDDQLGTMQKIFQPWYDEVATDAGMPGRHKQSINFHHNQSLYQMEQLTDLPCSGVTLCSPKNCVMRERGYFSMCAAYFGSMSSSTDISLLRIVLTRNRSSSEISSKTQHRADTTRFGKRPTLLGTLFPSVDCLGSRHPGSPGDTLPQCVCLS